MKKQSSPNASASHDEPYNNYMKAYRVARARMKTPSKDGSSIEASFGSPLKRTITESSSKSKADASGSKRMPRAISDSDSSDVDSIDFEIRSVGDVTIKEVRVACTLSRAHR